MENLIFCAVQVINDLDTETHITTSTTTDATIGRKKYIFPAINKCRLNEAASFLYKQHCH